MTPSLWQQLRDGDRDAWSRLVEVHWRLVYHWCQTRGLTNEADIREVVQEVFGKVWQSRLQFQGQYEGSFLAWLKSITENTANARLNSQQHGQVGVGGTTHQQLLEQESDSAPISEASSSSRQAPERILVLRSVLEEVKRCFEPKTWKAFWLVAAEGRDTADVARELEMTQGAVRVAKARVLKRLRQYQDFIDLEGASDAAR
jgi:RNA polymerase sigma-70 factor (ECF subfamily)